MTVEVRGRSPEEVSLRFETTGFCGGDSGHGGAATLTIGQEGGDFWIEGTTGGRTITVCVGGDWEICGLVRALVLLGRGLEAHPEMADVKYG
jgi:hypothetical protein